MPPPVAPDAPRTDDLGETQLFVETQRPLLEPSLGGTERTITPGFRSIEAYIESAEKKGRTEALAAARRRLAASLAPEDDQGSGQSLHHLRLAAGLSQAQLASAIQSSQPRIARLEAGQEEPSLGTLRRLAHALNIDMNTLNNAFK